MSCRSGSIEWYIFCRVFRVKPCDMNIKYLLPLVFSSLCAVACKGHKTPQEAPVPRLTVAEARIDTLPARMEFVGRLSSNHDVTIQPRVAGYLLSIEFDNGMPVRRGQVLFRIDPADIDARLSAAEASLSSARAQLTEAENNYRRAVPLAEMEAISRSSLDQYTAQYASARAALKSAEASLRTVRLDKDYTVITSPIDGVVAATSASVGDLVGPGSQFTVLTTVSDLDSVSVNLSLPVASYLKLRGEGPSYSNADLLSDIRLSLAGGEEYPEPGRYSYTAKNVADRMGTVVFVVKFPNREQLLKPGQFARVRADVGPARESVVIPAACVVESQGLESVWVVKPDSTLTFRSVTTGAASGGDVVVDEGLAAGEKVLAAGQMKAREGMKIVPEAAAAKH